jgi:hypothetical protein
MPLGVTFVESLVLLGVTAALTGVLAPVIVGITNHRRLNEQKQYEEELKRETALLDAQAEFLRDFSTAVFDYQEKALAVSYAGWLSPERFKERWGKYDEESFELLGRIGSQVSRARILFSTETADRLLHFYRGWLEDEFDTGLSQRARDAATTPADWKAWHDPMHLEVEERVTDLIRAVAEEAELTYEQQRRRLQPQPGRLRRFSDLFSANRSNVDAR